MSADQPNYRLPVKRTIQPPATFLQQATPALMRGAALVAAGIVGQWALRAAAGKVLRLPSTDRGRARKVVKSGSDPARADAIIEELVIARRVIVRR